MAPGPEAHAVHLKKAACLRDRLHLQDCGLRRVAAAFREAESDEPAPSLGQESVRGPGQSGRWEATVFALLWGVPWFHLNRSPAEGGGKARQLRCQGLEGSRRGHSHPGEVVAACESPRRGTVGSDFQIEAK